MDLVPGGSAWGAGWCLCGTKLCCSSMLPFFCKTPVGVRQRWFCPSLGQGLCLEPCRGARHVATPLPWVAGKFLRLPAHSSNRVEWHLTIKNLLSLRGAVTLSPNKADTSNTWFKSELQFLDTIQENSWSSAGTSLGKEQTFTLFIWLFRWLARLSGWRSFFGKGKMSGLMQLQEDSIGSFTDGSRSGQKAVAVTKQLGKLYCWRELMLSTKALHCCVSVKSNFTLILCVWGKNWQRGEKKINVKH